MASNHDTNQRRRIMKWNLRKEQNKTFDDKILIEDFCQMNSFDNVVGKISAICTALWC